MIGRFTTGRRGLGMLEVIGRRRVPSPPAITTAFMSEASSSRDDNLTDCDVPEGPLSGRPSTGQSAARATGGRRATGIRRAPAGVGTRTSVGRGVRPDEAADLNHVKDPCPPVEGCTPPGERPSENSSE